ncbi:hypothetical protein SKAU_G00313240 [Synaphobranchus kaupii]|uniref:Uncharacterized protein n=1 Tax=Synaphobranchus kaupii TaxID=118154 RepID=A0A9Q1ES35_SYNKA|nr:hypothetical protein SKAU_G00313240 [Synaphobranchus kaupii]
MSCERRLKGQFCVFSGCDPEGRCQKRTTATEKNESMHPTDLKMDVSLGCGGHREHKLRALAARVTLMRSDGSTKACRRKRAVRGGLWDNGICFFPQ